MFTEVFFFQLLVIHTNFYYLYQASEAKLYQRIECFREKYPGDSNIVSVKVPGYSNIASILLHPGILTSFTGSHNLVKSVRSPTVVNQRTELQIINNNGCFYQRREIRFGFR